MSIEMSNPYLFREGGDGLESGRTGSQTKRQPSPNPGGVTTAPAAPPAASSQPAPSEEGPLSKSRSSRVLRLLAPVRPRAMTFLSQQQSKGARTRSNSTMPGRLKLTGNIRGMIAMKALLLLIVAVLAGAPLVLDRVPGLSALSVFFMFFWGQWVGSTFACLSPPEFKVFAVVDIVADVSFTGLYALSLKVNLDTFRSSKGQLNTTNSSSSINAPAQKTSASASASSSASPPPRAGNGSSSQCELFAPTKLCPVRNYVGTAWKGPDGTPVTTKEAELVMARFNAVLSNVESVFTAIHPDCSALLKRYRYRREEAGKRERGKRNCSTWTCMHLCVCVVQL